MTWSEWIDAHSKSIRDANQWRGITCHDGPALSRVSFASNDYLGLSKHPRVRAAAIEAIQRFGTGANAARLVAGTRSVHLELEDALARWQRTERALVFSSGYAANMAVLSVLGTEDVTIFSDELNHASIIDGCRLAKARKAIYRHCDLEHLHTLMKHTTGRKIVVSDTVFSMDGDVAPTAGIARLCLRQDALLILDEAHAVLEPLVDYGELPVLRVGTLSKTFGALGGWVAGSQAIIELLINCARPFIFTSALSPADSAAARCALQIFVNAEGEQLRSALRRAIEQLRPNHRSPIVPMILGDERTTLAAAELLYRQGLHVPAIRPPTVPKGTSRLRIALSAAHTPAMVAHLKERLAQLPWPYDPRH